MSHERVVQISEWLVRLSSGFGSEILLTITFSFLFDIFLGPNYNAGPPSVKYITVGLSKAILPAALIFPLCRLTADGIGSTRTCIM